MKFWDSSALVPLILEESSSDKMVEIHNKDPNIMVWWSAEIESISALARMERENLIDSVLFIESKNILNSLKEKWYEVQPIPKIKSLAIRLLRVHSLKTADSLQLAAALTACEQNPQSLPFVCLDNRLNIAAQKEGFSLYSDNGTYKKKS